MKIITVIGTRPEAIKMSPVISRLKACNDFESKVITTGQHKDLLDAALNFFLITPDYCLEMQDDLSLAKKLALMISELNDVFHSESPSLILVHGDTCSAVAGAMTAFYNRVKVGHVEAGLRTYQMFCPYPEEANRRLISNIAHLHFAPTFKAKENLIREKVLEQQIFVTGNTGVETLLATKAKTVKQGNQILVTIHRRENWGEAILQVCSAIKELLLRHSNLTFLIPAHPNPEIRNVFMKSFSAESRVTISEPLIYSEFIEALCESLLVLTDSGGVQEESATLGIPTLVLRDATERENTPNARLVKAKKDSIIKSVDALLTDKQLLETMSKPTKIYGDGIASKRVVNGLRYGLGIHNVKPVDFIAREDN